jgi:1-acyl-sn-glycerol-3-phosphate acyltransferase
MKGLACTDLTLFCSYLRLAMEATMNGWHYSAFTPTEREETGERWRRIYAPWDWLIDPVFFGHEHVDAQRPALWVGNHSIMAFADGSLMLRELYVRHGIVMRSLGLHDHFKVPGWGHWLVANGAVDGTRENCTAMMAAGEHILVYPGGGGEVMKRQGEQHTLRWKKRTGFARMAIENNYPIQPFATVGADDCWDILYDNNKFRETRLGRWLLANTRFKAEEIPPLLKGIGPTLLPKPQRMYFCFFPPVYPDEFTHLPIEEGALAMRNKVERIVQDGIKGLLAYRENDPQRSFSTRLIAKLGHSSSLP